MESASSWFRGVKGKLLIAAFIPVVGFIIVCMVSHSGLGKLGSLLSYSNKDIIPNLAALGDMRQARNKYGYQIFAAMSMPTPEKRAERVKIARGAIEEFATAFKAYQDAPTPPELEDSANQTKKVIDEYLTLLTKCADLVDTGKPENFAEVQKQLDGRLWELGTMMHKMSDQAVKYYKATADTNTKTAEEAADRANFILISLTASASLLIFIILMWIASQISKSVGSIAARLTQAGGHVASSVEQLNEAGNNLSQSSTEAAASLEETVAALEEMSSMVKMNSDNAKQAAALSVSSREAAEKGENEIHHLIQSMTKISQSSKKIEEIISVIDDIAFQTNLLALNAAVEAARAGEQGKGFAVVAEAVRGLAQRSAASAKDISSLIKESVSQIDEGSEIADQSGTVLANIVNSIKKVSGLNNEISAASSEQTTGIQQISKAMNQLDQSSQANAASAEEIAATSSEINNLANTALNLTVELNAVVLGGKAQSNATTETPLAITSNSRKIVATTKVVPFKKETTQPKNEVAAKTSSEDVIPFDEDERAKVGNTSGF